MTKLITSDIFADYMKLLEEEQNKKHKSKTTKRVATAKRNTPIIKKNGLTFTGFSKSEAGSVFINTITKKPEVMFKITGGSKSQQGIYAHLKYISRNGKLEISNHDEFSMNNLDEISDYNEAYCNVNRISKKEMKFKQTTNMVFSMPKGTDKNKMESAFKEFAKKSLSDFRYFHVMHNDNKNENPHIHLCIYNKSKSPETKKNFRIGKSDIQPLREQWAKSLQKNGIECNATSRIIRGNPKKELNNKIINLNKRLSRNDVEIKEKINLISKQKVDDYINKYDNSYQIYKEISQKLLSKNRDTVQKNTKLRREEKRLGMLIRNYTNSFIPITLQQEILQKQIKTSLLDYTKAGNQNIDYLENNTKINNDISIVLNLDTNKSDNYAQDYLKVYESYKELQRGFSLSSTDDSKTLQQIEKEKNTLLLINKYVQTFNKPRKEKNIEVKREQRIDR